MHQDDRLDPQSDATALPGEPPLPSVYLRQGAFGFLGATTTAWVGFRDMQGADWIVAAFLKAMLGGASLGRATLESKQDFMRWLHQQGNDLDVTDEKTLLHFVLLGDPSIHPVKAATPAGVVSAAMLGASASPAAVMARRVTSWGRCSARSCRRCSASARLACTIPLPASGALMAGGSRDAAA